MRCHPGEPLLLAGPLQQRRGLPRLVLRDQRGGEVVDEGAQRFLRPCPQDVIARHARPRADRGLRSRRTAGRSVRAPRLRPCLPPPGRSPNGATAGQPGAQGIGQQRGHLFVGLRCALAASQVLALQRVHRQPQPVRGAAEPRMLAQDFDRIERHACRSGHVDVEFVRQRCEQRDRRTRVCSGSSVHESCEHDVEAAVGVVGRSLRIGKIEAGLDARGHRVDAHPSRALRRELDGQRQPAGLAADPLDRVGVTVRIEAGIDPADAVAKQAGSRRGARLSPPASRARSRPASSSSHSRLPPMRSLEVASKVARGSRASNSSARPRASGTVSRLSRTTSRSPAGMTDCTIVSASRRPSAPPPRIAELAAAEPGMAVGEAGGQVRRDCLCQARLADATRPDDRQPAALRVQQPLA